MTELAIQIKQDQRCFTLGETVEGVILWNLSARIEKLVLLLYWQTSGKPKRDKGICGHMIVKSPQLTGQRPFSFVLPHGPSSFQGKCFSVSWHLELNSDTELTAVTVLEVSHLGRTINILDDAE